MTTTPASLPIPTPRPASGIALSLRSVVFALSILLFTVALFLPALHFHTVNGATLNKTPGPGVDLYQEDWPGYEALLMSALAPLLGEFAGIANLFLIVAWFFLLRDQMQRVAIFAGLAAGSAMLTLQLFSTDAPLDEGGGRNERMTHLGLGFYVWVASIVVPLLAGVLWFNRRASALVPAVPVPPPPPPPPPRA